MDNTCRTKTVQSLVKDIEKSRIMLTHKLQRKEGQWNRLQKSYLIDSLLRKYPINPTYGIKEEEIISIIDGVQRLSVLRDYLNDGFALSKNLDPVNINGVQKDISGKKFSKLDEETQETIKDAELQLYELTNCTEKDVREMFRRQNSGKSLNNTQMRGVIETDEMSIVINNLISHPFFEKVLSPAKRKKDLDKDIIRETLMLIETNVEKDYTSFKSSDIDNFIMEYQADINYEKIDILKESLDKLEESFAEIKIKPVSIPMVIYSAYRVLKDKKSFSKLVAKINEFIETYDANEEYKQFCQSGTSEHRNVRGRFDFWRKIIKEL